MNGVKKLPDIFKIDFHSPMRDEEIAELEKRQAEAERIARYHRQAPERYWNESLMTFCTETDAQKKALDTASNFCGAVKCGSFRSLVMLGPAGTGKTHLALGIVRECGGLYRLSPNVVEEIRRAKSFSSKETEADILEKYGSARLLVIDEIGRGVQAAAEQYMLYQIINGRYNRRLPTVLVSNQTKKEFLNYVGIAAADRLTESAQVVEFTGRSYRAELRRIQR